jgi:hypothetical protein
VRDSDTFANRDMDTVTTATAGKTGPVDHGVHKLPIMPEMYYRCRALHHKQRQALAQTSDNDRMIVDRPLTVFQLLDGLWLSLRDQNT